MQEEEERLALLSKIEDEERRVSERIEVIQQVKLAKLKKKQKQFMALKRLALVRLNGATWMEKNGSKVFYDEVNWKDKVNVVKDEIKEIVGEEILGLKDIEFEKEGKHGTEEKKSRDTGEISIQEVNGKQKEDSATNEGPSLGSEWIDVEVNGMNMKQNIVTNEFASA